MPKRSGRKSASQTPAPLKDRIRGSKVNPKGSASSEKSASAIKLDAKTLVALSNKLKEFREKHPNKKNITLADLKAVYRRGSGAYSSTHRPTISGGKPNTRNAWSMARVNKFLLKAGGTKVKKAYIQDDDLMKMHLGGDMSKHLAPNGKPSNLTHEQWHLVRTPEFKAWFGDWENDPKNASKVIDENGEPLVCNHSSRESDIDVFYGGRIFRTKKNQVKPIWFTYKEFREYASGDDIFQYQCFLNIKNLFDYTKIEDVNKLKKSYIEKNGEMLPDYDFDMDWDAQEQFNLPAYIYEMGYDGYKFTDEYSIVVFNSNQIKLADGSNTTFDGSNPDIRYEGGGSTEDNNETYKKWRSLVNMSYSELKRFYDSKEGKEAGLSSGEAKSQGIDSGRESARMIMKMKSTPKSEWTPDMWRWAKKQISFISRMSGNKGSLYDDKGKKTRKHTSLLIWGHNPEKKSSMKYENGGQIGVRYFIGRPEVDAVGRFGKKRAFWKTCVVDENGNKNYGGYTLNFIGSAKNIKLDGIQITQKEFDKLTFDKKMENGGEMDVLMEDTIQRMDDPNFADPSYYRKGGKINYSEYYKSGGKTKSCEVLDENGERRIDRESIEKLTTCVNNLPQTKEFHVNKDGEYTEERKRLHKEIIYDIKKDLVCVENKNPIAILMGGSPASGKSTFLKKYRPYLLSSEILKVDADEIRSKLPEYKGYNATQTHLETKDIVSLLLSDRNIGIPCLFDLIYDGTMNNTKSYLPLIKLLKSLGYRVYVVYIDNVPKDVVVNRALLRYKKSGRFVPLEVIDDFFGKGKTALNEIKKEVDGYMIVDGGDTNYEVIEKGGMQLPVNRRYSNIGKPIKITTEEVVREYKKGGELDPDDKTLKNQIVHKSGEVGGMLVGKRHSEGGIKAVNKSTGQPLEMEGGEVVITRKAVSDEKKREFEGEMLTNREILSKINQSGGGVSFAEGGEVDKDDCGCNHYDSGGKLTTDKRTIKKMMELYPEDFQKGMKEESSEHHKTFTDLKGNKITVKSAIKNVVAEHLSKKPNYYKNYMEGGMLSLDGVEVPSLKEFIRLANPVRSPFFNDDELFFKINDDGYYYRGGMKNSQKISDLFAYQTYLYDNFDVVFSELPPQIKNALTLGKQGLIDNYINS